MTNDVLPMTRRALLAGAAATSVMTALPARAAAQPVMLRAGMGTLALRPGQPETAVARLTTPGRDGVLRVGRGDTVSVAFENGLPDAALLNFRAGTPATVEPLLARRAVAAGGRDAFGLPQRFAGTFLLDLRLSPDAAGPLPALPLVVAETEPVAVDRDEVLLIEEWRLAPDGRALAPGQDPTEAAALFTVNGKTGLELPVRASQRLRLRFINGCQRSIIAIKISDHDLRVMAIDGHPAEPIVARGGQLVLAPGTRVDAFVDALRPPGSRADIWLHDGTSARPVGGLVYADEPPTRATPTPAAAALPSNGLPERLDLKAATRANLPLGGPDWTRPGDFSPAAAPAFSVKMGRIAVLALANPTATPMVFHLHGAPFRHLDRLDDGWKPYWLDTLVIAPQQTERIAFLADRPGRWLIEAMAPTWSAPRWLRSYAVE